MRSDRATKSGSEEAGPDAVRVVIAQAPPREVARTAVDKVARGSVRGLSGSSNASIRQGHTNIRSRKPARNFRNGHPGVELKGMLM